VLVHPPRSHCAIANTFNVTSSDRAIEHVLMLISATDQKSALSVL
jgi:hypothetical protein